MPIEELVDRHDHDMAKHPGRPRVIRRWVNRERGRYYIAVVTDDLFGGWNLQRFWGGCDSRRGGQLSRHIEDPAAIEAQLERIARRRRQRDYVEAGAS